MEVDQETESTGRDGKFRLTDMPGDRRMERPTKLSTLYLLRSVSENPDGQAVVRSQIPGPLQMMRLLAHAKIGEMLGPPAQDFLLDWAALLTKQARVAELSVVRDRSRLPEVVDEILRWHARDVAHAEARSARS